MTILDLLALALQSGDKVHITFAYPSNGVHECDAYFMGFRHYGKGLVRDFLELYPVFYEAGRDGHATRRLLHGVSSWSPSALRHVSRLSPMKLTADAVVAICDLKAEVDRAAHDALLTFMADYARCHPGRPKIYLDPDGSMSATLQDKYCSYSGTIEAVSFVDGRILYDVSTEMELEKDVPDYRDASRGGVYVEDETYLYKLLLGASKEPYYPEEDESFFEYIRPGAKLRWNDNPEFIERFMKPGPVVTVMGAIPPNGAVTADTSVTIILCNNERRVTVKAKELEPLES